MKRPTVHQRVEMSRPVVPPAVEWNRTSVTLPKALWGRLDDERDLVNATRPHPEKLTRDAFLRVLLEWACEEMAEQRGAKSKK